MSEFDQDPSANTGRFRAFVEGGGDEDLVPSRRFPASPRVLAGVGVVILAIIIVIAVLA
jgi:hypothetical protein